VMQFVLHASGQERGRFDQAFDFGIGAAVGFEQQPACCAWIFLGKFLKNLPEEKQLALIMRNESLIHDIRLWPSRYLEKLAHFPVRKGIELTNLLVSNL